MKKEVNGINGVLEAYSEVRRGGFAPSDKASLVENINMSVRKAKHIEVCYSLHTFSVFYFLESLNSFIV